MMTNQSFGVEDIRRVRNETSKRYEGKSFKEISREISDSAKTGHELIEKLRQAKSAHKNTAV